MPGLGVPRNQTTWWILVTRPWLTRGQGAWRSEGKCSTSEVTDECRQSGKQRLILFGGKHWVEPCGCLRRPIASIPARDLLPGLKMSQVPPSSFRLIPYLHPQGESPRGYILPTTARDSQHLPLCFLDEREDGDSYGRKSSSFVR